jgi:hypothetical protein
MPDVTITSERRKERRKRPLGLVYVELSSTNGGMLRDLSEQGFAMRAMMPLRPGDSTPFGFSLDPETRLEGHCKVLWVEEDGRVAGMEFTEVSQELPKTVREWLVENSYAAPSASSPAKPAMNETSTLQELREELRSITPNVHSAERAEKGPERSRAGTSAKEEFRPIPVQTRNGEPVFIEPSNSAAATSTSTPAPVSESSPESEPPSKFETLAILPELESAPEDVILDPRIARSGISLAIKMMFFLALLACAVVFHRQFGNAVIWLGQKIAGSDVPEISYAPKIDESSSASPATPPAVAPPASVSNPFPPATETTNSAATETEPPPSADAAASSATPKKSIEVPPVIQNTSPQTAKNPSTAATAAPVPLPAKDRNTTFSPPGTAAPDQAGQQEYLAAQEILKDRHSTSGVSEAVRLLWVAVEKGNSGAEVALAELYHKGHGVARSCDQTRILLTAAAKKGNAEGQRLLDQFLKEGCE